MSPLNIPAARLCICTLALFATFTRPSQSSAQSNSASVERKVITTEDFRKVLMEHTWTWERAGVGPGELKFLPNGTVRHTNFVTKYQIKNLREVEIGTSKGKVKLTFDPAYMTWEGIDFEGQRPIYGRRK